MNRKVMITGATGLVGTALRRAISFTGMEGLSMVRNLTDAPANSFLWDPTHPANPADNTDALEGCEYAVHLAGANLSAHRWTPAYKQTIVDSRVNSSQALMTILSRMKVPPRVLVCASATGFFGDRGDELLTEASAPGIGFLPDVCKVWDQCSDGAAKLGIRVVHLRFGVVLAPGGGALKQLLPVFKAGLGGRLGDGRQWMSWVTLEDVVRAIQFAMETASIRGPYNTVAPQPVTNREFTHALGKAVHRPAPWIVPGFALKILFGQMAQDTLLASTRAVPAALEAAGFVFRSPEIGGALERCLRPVGEEAVG